MYFKATSDFLFFLLAMQYTVCEIKLGVDWRINQLSLFYFGGFEFCDLILDGKFFDMSKILKGQENCFLTAVLIWSNLYSFRL